MMTDDEPRADRLDNYKKVLPGDIVINRMRAFQGAVGLSDYEGLVSPDYLVLRPSDGTVGRYLHYLFRSQWFVGEMVSRLRGIGSTNQGNVRTPRINIGDLGDIRIPLLPKTVQLEIAEFLETETRRLDGLIEKKRRMIKLLEERRIAMVHHAIIGARSDERPVAALAEYVNGWPFKPDDFTEDGLPVVRIQQLVDPESPADRYSGVLPEKARLKDGDLVFSWSGSLQVRVWDRGDAYLNQHLFRVKPADGIDPVWLRFALESAVRLFEAHMHGSAMTHITRPMMKAVRIPVPSIEDQEDLASLIDAEWVRLEAIEARLSKQIELLAEHRLALITAAVTGELDVAQSIVEQAS